MRSGLLNNPIASYGPPWPAVHGYNVSRLTRHVNNSFTRITCLLLTGELIRVIAQDVRLHGHEFHRISQ